MNYETDDVAWAALYIAIFLFLVLFIYASFSLFEYCLMPRKHHKIIRHLIITPQP